MATATRTTVYTETLITSSRHHKIDLALGTEDCATGCCMGMIEWLTLPCIVDKNHNRKTMIECWMTTEKSFCLGRFPLKIP